MNHIKNFRPLAEGLKNKFGQIIKPHTIFRSGYVSDADANDLEILKVNHIKTIYDLRNEHEINRDFRIDGIKIKHFAIPQPHIGKFSKEFLIELSKGNVDDFILTFYEDHLITSPVIKPALKEIILEESPFLFHCHAGKDRTGAVGALIMWMLDFSLDAIIEEYIKLDDRIIEDGNRSVREYHQLSEDIVKKLEPMHGIKSLYIRSYFEEIKKKYQSVNQYLIENFGITQKMILDFKSRMLVNT